MPNRRSTLAALAALVSPTLGLWAQTGGFPFKPVKLVVPYAPGGITDTVARLLGVKLQEKWGQSVLVENRAGASGGIGADVASKSAPDGYTLMVGINSLLLAPMLDSQLRFDLERDFAPVTLMGTSDYVLVASAEMGVQRIKAFDDALKASSKNTATAPSARARASISTRTSWHASWVPSRSMCRTRGLRLWSPSCWADGWTLPCWIFCRRAST